MAGLAGARGEVEAIAILLLEYDQPQNARTAILASSRATFLCDYLTSGSLCVMEQNEGYVIARRAAAAVKRCRKTKGNWIQRRNYLRLLQLQ
jgi:hypothetical protein